MSIFKRITTIAPMRMIGFILFVMAWINGDIHGLLAWAILLFFIDIKFILKK